MSETLYKTSIPVTAKKISSKGPDKKAFNNYLEKTIANLSQLNRNTEDDGWVEDLRGFLKAQPDLLYAISILVSEGRNKNGDGFLRPVLAEIYETPRHKFVDFEHDVEAEKKSKNPEEYKVVGHMYDSQMSLQNGFDYIPDHQVFRDTDGKFFPADSKYRNQPLEIAVAWVLYQFEYPELATMIKNEFAMQGVFGLDSSNFGVSMEVLFDDFKFRVGAFDPNEEFSFDATTIGAIEARKGTPFAEELGELWKAGKQYQGLPITRILGGNIFFSGMAITKNKANPRSWNLSVAHERIIEKAEASTENSHLNSILKAVAASDENAFDMKTCEIINGEPSCGCLEQAVAARSHELVEKINALANELGKSISDLSTEKSDGFLFITEDEIFNTRMNDTVNRLQEGVRNAQKKLRNLFENNLDSDLSGEEILEFVEEIEHTIRESRVSLSTLAEELEKKTDSTTTNNDKKQKKTY